MKKIIPVFILTAFIFLLIGCAGKPVDQTKLIVYPRENIENAEPFYFEGNNGKSVLLIHGWTGSPSHLRELGMRLNNSGYTVYGVRLTGHCTNMGEMENVTSSQWIDDAQNGYNKLSENFNEISIVGFSMGGALALITAANNEVKSVVCISPALIPLNKQAYLVKWIRPFLPRFRFRTPHDFRENEAVEYSHEYIGSPTKTVPELLKVGKTAVQSLGRIDIPLLVIQSKTDESVDPKVPDLIITNIATPPDLKEIFMLENSRHIATIDVEREILYEKVLTFAMEYF